jgi:hypothetical protein
MQRRFRIDRIMITVPPNLRKEEPAVSFLDQASNAHPTAKVASAAEYEM